jgi:hypothetical protein
MRDDAKPPEPYRPHWWSYADRSTGDRLWASPAQRLGLWAGLSLLLSGALYALALQGLYIWWLMPPLALLGPALLFAGIVAPQGAYFPRAFLLGLVAGILLQGGAALAALLLSLTA